jgi:threonine/homoserine/homoserine lactone efflux protein
MPDFKHLAAFFVAALILALTPGPGIFYVLTRSLASGKREGALSAVGTFLGGLVHVLAAALGLSVILATSATAYSVVKFGGAAYLVFLGIQMIRTRNVPMASEQLAAGSKQSNALVQGILTEVLNPKTALFFLSFVPQFVVRANGHVFAQFVLLGTLSVVLNACADLLVVQFAGPLGQRMRENPRFRTRQRTASGLGMIGLGAFVAAADSH